MKKVIIGCCLLVCAAISFAQQTNPPEELTKEYYLQKSKKQKTGAFIFLGLGTASIVTGVLIDNKESDYAGISGAFDVNAASGLLMIGGALFVAGSIPMFIASGKNKHKAMEMAFRFQKIPQLQNTTKINRTIPSINLKISL